MSHDKNDSRLLYTMTGFFIEGDKFSRGKAENISTTPKMKGVVSDSHLQPLD